MSDCLPPFGVRRVRRTEPFAVVQISAESYDEDARRTPDALLSYVDEDDGEKILVGSSFELKQRLSDPLPPTAPRINFYNRYEKKFENRLIHLFDISSDKARTSVWKPRRTTWKREQRDYEDIYGRSREDDNISSIDLNAESITSEEASAIKDVLSQSSSKPTSEIQHDVATNVSSTVPALVEHLADVLLRTSDTLRKAVEKSQQSRSVAIEDVLTGVGSIAVEIGTFGVSLLAALNETAANSSGSLTEDTSAPSMPVISATVPDQGHCRALADETIPNSTVEDSTSQVHHVTTSARIPDYPKCDNPVTSVQKTCDFCKSQNIVCVENSWSQPTCGPCFLRGYACSLAAPSNDVADLALGAGDALSPSASPISKAGSILDQDTEDADFSRRYPPLLSLRRANTIAGMHTQYTAFSDKDVASTSLGKHNSWKSMPLHMASHRQEVGEHFGVKAAQDLFSAHNNSSYPTRGPPMTSTVSQDVNKANLSSMLEPYEHSRMSWDQPALVDTKTNPSGMSKAVCPSDGRPISTANQNGTRSPIANTEGRIATQFESKRNTLPGAWPDVPETQSPEVAATAESSGAFFYRMMRDNPSRRQKHTPDTNNSLNRHRSFVKQKPDHGSFIELNRSHTVSNVKNPASRLNQPFEPWFPAPSLISPISTTEGTVNTNKNVQKSQSETREMGKLPERSSWMTRPFSPVWEENIPQRQHQVEKTRRIYDTVDRNGESVSMYSPPPHHMRSVPDLRTSKSNKITFYSQPIYDSRFSKKFNAADTSMSTNSVATAASPMINIPSNASGAWIPKPLPSVPLSATTYAPASAPATPWSNVLEAPAAVSYQIEDNTQISEPPVRTRSPKDTRFSTSTPRMWQCLAILRGMGYGSGGDENLLSRLHIYVEAANGDVMKAVEMIEEDREASVEQSEAEMDSSRSSRSEMLVID